jgi:hypothetical protein
MDGDPSVEPELDSFSLTLPLPYRVALIIVLGMLLFKRNMQDLYVDRSQLFGHGAQIFIICHF